MPIHKKSSPELSQVQGFSLWFYAGFRKNIARSFSRFLPGILLFSLQTDRF